MKLVANFFRFLTDPAGRLVVILTLVFFVIFPVRTVSAATFENQHVSTGTPIADSAEYTIARNQRLQSLGEYVRQQAPKALSGLPDILRSPVKLVIGGFQNSADFASVSLSGDGDNRDASPSSMADPGENLISSNAPGSEETSLSSTYHHRRGLLPTHDAMMAGMHSKVTLFDHYMGVDVHPYVAQSYFSARNYYGTEVTLNLASPEETSNVTQPWGKIVLGYTNGDSSITDQGRGLNLHGELRFSDNLSLNTGLRQGDATGGSNYILLQWKLATE